MKTRNIKGAVVLIVSLTVAVIGSVFGGMAFVKHTSKKAAVKIEQVTTDTANNNTEIGQKVSAGIVTIQKANTMAPESPSKAFISRETTHLIPLLPTPDYKSLFEAEARRTAVMEGRIEESNKLYGKAEEKNNKLLEEKIQLKAELDKVKQDLFFEAGQSSMFKIISASVIVLLLIVSIITIWLKITNNSVMSGLREFVAYSKDDKVLGDLREAMDSKVKKSLGL